MKKSEKTKKFKLNPIAVVALVLCVLIAVYCGTTAWLTSGAPINPIRLLSLDDFSYTVLVSADGGATWDEASGVITIQQSEINNLQNYRFTIKQNGNGVAFVRVRLSNEWKVTDSDGNVTRLQGDYNLPFTVDETKSLDNRNTDGYVYYMGAFPTDEEGVNFFNGFDLQNFDTSALSNYSGVELSIDITIDAVQFNRYQQHWGVEALPWK